MYDVSQIKTAFDGLIGIRQNADPAGWQLTDLTTSSSGLWIDGVHPLLTIDNLVSIAPEFDLVDSDQSAINTAFTAWLKNKFEDSIIKAIQTWINKKSGFGTSNNLLERTQLFDTHGSIYDLDAVGTDVVGFEFIPIREQSVSVTIKEIGLQLNGNQDLAVKLFEAGSVTPTNTETITYSGAGSLQFTAVDWTLNGLNSYWIVYEQSALTPNQSINGIKDYSARKGGLSAYPNSKFFNATAFKVDADDLVSIWDISDNSFTSSTNYGLNFKITVECDYTEFIIEQKDIFKDLVWLQIGIDLLREMAFNPSSRVNRNESNIDRAQLIYEIDGDSQGRAEYSLNGKFEAALNAIQFDRNGIGKHCLPCRRRGIRTKVLG